MGRRISVAPLENPMQPMPSLTARIAAVKRTIRELQLEVIASAVEGRAFTAQELLECVRHDSDLAYVLATATTARQVDRRLWRLATVPGPRRLVQIGSGAVGSRWVIETHR